MSNRSPILLSTGRTIEYVPDASGVEWWLIQGDHSAEMTDAEYDEFSEIVRQRARRSRPAPIEFISVS